jgi:ABC-type lipoprotein release transport system permease subunit
MSNEIIIAVISFIGTVLGSFSGMKLTAYRIEQLETKVEKLNTYAERIPILDEQMKVVNHRLSDLESKS